MTDNDVRAIFARNAAAGMPERASVRINRALLYAFNDCGGRVLLNGDLERIMGLVRACYRTAPECDT